MTNGRIRHEPVCDPNKPRKPRTWRIEGVIYSNEGFRHGAPISGETWRNDTVDVPSQGGDASNLRS